MAGAILLILVIAALIKPESKKISICIMLFMWFMYCFVYYKGDLQGFEITFNQIVRDGEDLYNGLEQGYVWLVLLLGKLGLPFKALRIVFGTAYVLLSYNFARKTTDKIALALAAMTIFPLFVFVSVFRSGFASVIILNAILFLIDGKKYGGAKYTAGVLLASLFHRTSLFFLVLLFARRKYTKKQLAIASGLVLVASIAVFANIDKVLKLLEPIVGTRGAVLFGGDGTVANTNGIIAISIVVLITLAMTVASDYVIKNNESGLLTDNQNRLDILSLNTALLFAVMIPAFTQQMLFLRYIYMVYPMFAINAINASYITKERTWLFKKIPVAVIIVGAVTVMWAIYVDLPYAEVGDSVFDNFVKLTLG